MNGTDALWFIAFFLVSVFAVILAWQVDIFLGVAFWVIGSLILIVLRPE